MRIEFTPVVKNLVISNVALFILSSMFPALVSLFALYDLKSPSFQVYQLSTYAFLHADFFHLLFNMLTLFFIGTYLEKNVGSKRFAVYYFIPLVAGALLTEIVSLFIAPHPHVSVGASIAIWSILVIFAFMFPNMKLYLFFIIPVKAWILVLLLFLFESFMINGLTGISHLGHVSGAICGFITYLFYNNKRNLRRTNYEESEILL